MTPKAGSYICFPRILGCLYLEPCSPRIQMVPKVGELNMLSRISWILGSQDLETCSQALQEVQALELCSPRIQMTPTACSYALLGSQDPRMPRLGVILIGSGVILPGFTPKILSIPRDCNYSPTIWRMPSIWSLGHGIQSSPRIQECQDLEPCSSQDLEEFVIMLSQDLKDTKSLELCAQDPDYAQHTGFGAVRLPE